MAEEQLIPTPIIKQQHLTNGMICVSLANCKEFGEKFKLLYIEDTVHEYEISYKFIFNDDIEYYPNNTWKSTGIVKELPFTGRNNEFHIKVPLLLSPYKLEYNFTVIARKSLHHDHNTANNTIGNQANQQIIDRCTSINHTTNIASILIENTFKKGDIIHHIIPNDSYVSSGVILEILENDMIKIKTDGSHKIIQVHSSKIVTDTIWSDNIIDITNRAQAEIDLILRINDEQSKEMYYKLCEVLEMVCITQIIPDLTRNYIGYYKPYRDSEFMASFIALNIHQFVYSADYNYRFECILGETQLCLEQQWKYVVWREYNNIKKGYNHRDLQNDRINYVGYSCDICRDEMNWFEYSYHCQCGDDGDHDFCISCIHSILNQYNSMNQFISELLKNILDNNCIEEIVVFCVGKAIKFDVTNTDNNNNNVDEEDIVMFENEGFIEENVIIDDSKDVGSKRSIKTVDSARKHRKLQ